MPPPHHSVGTVPSVSPRQRTGAPSPRPGAMPPTHQHPHPNPPHHDGHAAASLIDQPSGHAPSSSTGSMGMPPQNNGMPPAHHPQRTPRMTPDNAAMAMGMYNSGRPGSMGGGPGGPGAVGGGVGAAGMYGSGPFGGPSTPQMGMVGVSGNDGVAQGGTPNRTAFLNTPAQAYEMMNAGANNGNGGGNTNGPSSNAANGGGNATNGGGNPNAGNNEPYFSMPPPRPPSHATNSNPGAQTPQQAHQQALASQQAAHHQHQINAQAAQHQHAMNQQQQHGQHGQQPHHPSHAHAHPPHQLGTPHMSQQQQHAQQQHAHQQHAQQQHAQQQQQQQHGSPPGNDVRMGTPVMHPSRPQSQPQRPPSQASRTPRAGPTPIPGAGPGVGGPQHTQQHLGGAPPPPGVSASSSSSSSSVGGGAPGPSAPNGAAATPGAHPLSSGPSALGSTPLTQTGMRAVPQPGAVPMHGMGAFAAMMPGMNMHPMGRAWPRRDGGAHRRRNRNRRMGICWAASRMPRRARGVAEGQARRAGWGWGRSGRGSGYRRRSASRPGSGRRSRGGRGIRPAFAANAAFNCSVSIRTVGVGMGQGVIRLLQFSGILSNEMKPKLQLHWWGDLVKEYFTPKAVMKLTLWRDSKRNEAKPFEIGVPILPRFFLVTTQSGVKSMSFTIDGARERTFGQNHSVVECVSAVWTYRYTNGYTVTLRGPLTVHVIVGIGPGGTTLKFEDFQFDANLHDKFVAIDAILGTRAAESTEQRIASMHAAAGMQGGAGRRAWTVRRGHTAWRAGECVWDPASHDAVSGAGGERELDGDLIAFAHEHKMGPKDSLKVMAQQIRDNGYNGQAPPGAGGPPAPSSGPPNSASANPGTNTSLGASFSTYQPPGPSPSGTLYSSAPPSLGELAGKAAQNNTAAAATRSIAAAGRRAPAGERVGVWAAAGAGPARSVGIVAAISSGGTTNTPALSNTSLKRKQAGDASSPTVGNPDQPTKRVPRKRVRAGTNGAG
ncbi:LIM-domain binding protein-domain-containing protein [Pholiota molesta]|nr:LIM-domain binding protein-domain-containing protein [Pholiota molesta]